MTAACDPTSWSAGILRSRRCFRFAKVKSRAHSRKLVFHPTLLAVGLSVLALTAGFHLLPRSDEYIRQAVVQQSVGAYLSSGAICPCPYSLMPLGNRCLGQSSYNHPNPGATVLCYPDDVTDAMVENWKASHR